jgi:calcineurin-like phosphoesterase family protein
MTKFDQIMQEYSRKHEDEIQDEIKNASTEKSSQIASLIKKTLASGHKVYLCTDWHLWRCTDKKARTIKERSDKDTVINKFNSVVTDDDLVIYLGDLCDGECEKKQQLGQILDALHGTKILVRGNNDLFDKSFYKSCGFQYVVDSFVWNDIIFTHVPVKNNHKMNVCGHLHGYRTFWIPYTNQIEVGAYEGRKKPIDLKFIINKQPSYAKTIKEVPEKFEESFDLFMTVNYRIEDPYHDEEVS